MDIQTFWDAVLRQDADEIREYFHPDAQVNWHNTNEHFVDGKIAFTDEYWGDDGAAPQWRLDKHIETKIKN